jgi:hypothetical protein
MDIKRKILMYNGGNGNMECIFYAHKGYVDYLELSIERTIKMCPNAQIVLLGDEDNKSIQVVKHENIDEYSNYSQKLINLFENFNTRNYNYYLFCFTRWFSMYEYMERHGIEKAIHIDSDILVNCDIRDYLQEENYMYSFDGGYTSCFTIEQLHKLCEFILDKFSTNESKINLKKIYEKRLALNQRGGVSDMTLISMYAVENRCFDVTKICEGRVFDHTIFTCDGFEMIQGKKKIYCVNRELYICDMITNMLIHLNTAHFQGDGKAYMKTYLDYQKLENGCYYYNYSDKKWELDKENIVFSLKDKLKIHISEFSCKFKKKLISIKSL